MRASMYPEIRTPVSVADGGTGAATAADARTALGLAIGTDVQAQDAALQDIADLTAAPGKVLAFNGASHVTKVLRASDMVVYGTGTDGGLALDGSSSIVVQGQTIAPVGGVYTLVADMVAQTVTFTGAATTLIGNGFDARCWKLVGEADHVIKDDGNNASGTVAGTGLSASGTLQRTSAAGGAGRSGAAAGNNGSNVSLGVGGAGGAGGQGGANAGGSGGTVTTATLAAGRNLYGSNLLTGWGGSSSSGPSSVVVSGGGGGGGGGHAGTSGNSGAGGGGAGRIRVFAFECDFAGTISARGGNGSAATGTNNGGGGGGGGGEAFLMTECLTRTPTVTAAGGTGGNPTGTGVAGSSGSTGTTRTFSPQ